MNIGYICQKFPDLTETFVYREVLGLKRSGLKIQTFSTWKPKPERLSEEAKSLYEQTYYIFPLDKKEFLKRNWQWLNKDPARYLGLLWFVFTKTRGGLKNRLRTLLHFFEAVYLATEIKERPIAHMHSHFAANSATIAMVISKLTGISFSFTAHAYDIFVNPILLKEKITSAKFLIAISDYNRQFLHKIAPTPETLEKIHVVRCGVDTTRFMATDKGDSTGEIRILSVGRMVEKKGFVYLVEACRILAESGHTFKCEIIGDGPQEKAIARMIEKYSLSSCVTLAGIVYQEEIRDYFLNSDIFVLPCVESENRDKDGIPVVLMEAMAMGIATISTDVSGIPELIEDRVSGILVKPQNAENLAAAIELLIEEPRFRKALGKSGRSRVLEEFDLNLNLKRLIQVYEKYFGDADLFRQKRHA